MLAAEQSKLTKLSNKYPQWICYKKVKAYKIVYEFITITTATFKHNMGQCIYITQIKQENPHKVLIRNQNISMPGFMWTVIPNKFL